VSLYSAAFALSSAVTHAGLFLYRSNARRRAIEEDLRDKEYRNIAEDLPHRLPGLSPQKLEMQHRGNR
jgi:hypothetical protein